MGSSEQILVSLRRIMRAVELHSKQVFRSHGITGPQALLLKQIQQLGEVSVGELAQHASLSQATVTDILLRLEKRGLIYRQRSVKDKRRVMITLSDTGKDLLKNSPPLLQERFLHRLSDLEIWEQTQILSTLQRIATMMDAQEIEAAPLLTTGPVSGGGVIHTIDSHSKSAQPTHMPHNSSGQCVS